MRRHWRKTWSCMCWCRMWVPGAHVEAQDLAGRYGARLTPLVEQPWGITEFVLIDPSGVCWHIGQNTPDSPSAGRLPDNPP